MAPPWFQADLVCPVCKGGLMPEGSDRLRCKDGCCEAGYSADGVLYALPTQAALETAHGIKARAWEVLQEQGIAHYESEPEKHLAVANSPRVALYDTFAALSQVSGRVLDIGCGPSGAIPRYLQGGDQIVGVDPYAGRPEKEIPFCQAMAEFLPFPDGYFDHVTMNSVLDHFVDARVAIVEAMRALAPEGQLHIFVSVRHEESRLRELYRQYTPQVVLDLTRKLRGVRAAGEEKGHVVPEGATGYYHMEFFNEGKMRALVRELGFTLGGFARVEMYGKKIGYFRVQRPSAG